MNARLDFNPKTKSTIVDLLLSSFAFYQVVSGGTGCSDYETDLSGVVGITPTGDWDTFATITS